MRIKFWCVARIIEYRLQLLDGAGNWDDPNVATFITMDRHQAYELARSHGGLLMSADGLPSEETIREWQSMCAEMYQSACAVRTQRAADAAASAAAAHLQGSDGRPTHARDSAPSVSD